MISIQEIKRRLPQDFIEKLYEEFSPLTIDRMLAGIADTRNTIFRVNLLKYSLYDWMEIARQNNLKFERVPWYTEAMVCKNCNEKQLQNLEIYKNGGIYLQSLSSMIPPLVLNPKAGEKILDVAAAPGSKTTQMATLMKNKGEIVANEIDRIRWERLNYNLDKQGVTICQAINGRGEKLGEQYPQYFDKVLVDVPCSGEGRFLIQKPKTYRDWSTKKVNQLIKVQKKLVASAYQALKPGGILVYSTCTILREENEEVVQWALENLPLQLLPIEHSIREAIPGSTKGLHPSMQYTIKILPDKKMEGFFVAKMQKR